MATQLGPLFPASVDMTAIPGSLVSPRWRTWLLLLRQNVDLSSLAIPVPPQLSQSATLPTTSMDGGKLSAGLYAISWYLSIVVAQPGSSAQVSIAWVDEVGPKSKTATLVDGSVTTTPQVDQRWLIYSKAATPISYSVTYVGATMQYDFRPVLQSVST